MNTELQNKVWSILPKEFKEEVKEIYLNAVEYHPCGYNHKTDLMKYLFGRHNLTSDAEGEETLICEKSKVQRAYNTSREIVKAEKPDSLMYSMHTQIMCVLENIFGSKCLPDAHEDNFAKSDLEPYTESKFNIKNNKEMNLCEILKGHEGETFYSPCYGYIILKAIKPHCYFSLFFDDNNYEYKFTKHGKISANNNADCVLFPSKDQCDWNKWVEEQKPKVPKTWNELVTTKQVDIYTIQCNAFVYKNNPNIIKSALALLKIHQLIEVGYGGNVTNEEWYNDLEPKFIIVEKSKEDFADVCVRKQTHRTPIAFHTSEQAEEFLSYPENIQLLKDYFMLPVTVQG